MLRRSLLSAMRTTERRQFSRSISSSHGTIPLSKMASPVFAVAGLALLAATAVATTTNMAKTDVVIDKDDDESSNQVVKEILALIASLEQKLDAVEKKLEATKTAPPPPPDSVVAPVVETVQEPQVDVTESNRAFLFIKPHANTHQVQTLVREAFSKFGLTVKQEGTLTAEEIGNKIDVHYGAIASKAVSILPENLNVSPEGQAGFESKFGLSWKDALDTKQVLNAKQACELLNCSGDELETLWRQSTTKLIKFGGGFYCGQVLVGEKSYFIINGFYMQMRGRYTTAPASLSYYEVEFDPKKMSWKAFRNDFLGSTDPAKASESSLRRVIFDHWEELGLPAKPDVGDNGMHGSASPFEAVAEVVNWTGKKLEDDALGSVLLTKLDKDTLELWLGDCQVPFNGKNKSIFDILEDLNTKEMLEQLDVVIAGLPAKIVAE